MAKHTMQELKQWQALPLDIKILMTQDRIRNWVREYDENGVYVSFSGGKDSTVLLDIVRNKCGYTNIPAVFVDVPTQYPELREFAKTFDNVVIIKPKISFMEVCEKYGFPLITKEVSNAVYDAKNYLTKLETGALQFDRQTDRQTSAYAIADLLGIERRDKSNQQDYINLKRGIIPNNIENMPVRVKQLYGVMPTKNGDKNNEYSKRYDKSKYAFFLDAEFNISDKCCRVMKKTPLHKYNHESGRKAITAEIAEESGLRTTNWINNGCNGFNLKEPKSTPLAFWTEQDILQYIKINNLRICPVYGDVIEDISETDAVEGQYTMSDCFGEDAAEFDAKPLPLKTTGCKRTGCMLCGFGCHLEKSPNRFELLKQTHPKMYALLDVVKNNGVTFREAIEWTNEHGNLDIKL